MTRDRNQGIQGTNVNIMADALAVGTGARASSRRISQETTQAALATIEELRRSLGTLELAGNAREEVSESIDDLEEAVVATKPDRGRVASLLARTVEALDKAGTVVTKVATLAEPIARLAGLFGVVIPRFS